MNYCSRCILPDTRPNLEIGPDGVCNACRAHELKATIDWPGREAAFQAVVESAKQRAQPKGYDCIVPVSGGKDSTWQTVKCLEYGLKPLAVTYATPARTDVGRKNLENLIDQGVDHIDYRISPEVERRFMKEAFIKFGSSAVPMHMALFSIPLRLAVTMSIPLVIWGENSAFEYGGTEEERTGFRLDRRWLSKYGVTHGTQAEDWTDTFSEKELTPYYAPGDEELERENVLAVFLGYYFEWDPEETYRVAKAHGFVSRAAGPKTGYYDYADIDDDFISIHHYLKWVKFGFTRDFDNLSLEIRYGRLGREEAVNILRERGVPAPEDDISRFCEFSGLSRTEFDEVCESFRNRKIWMKENGVWKIPGFLIPEFDWEDQSGKNR